MHALPNVTLHSVEGNSDKIYKVWVTQNQAGGFDLCSEYGARFGSMKYARPEQGVSHEAVLKAYEKLVASKIKGKSKYKPIAGDDQAATAVFTERDSQDAKIPIKLLNAIDAKALAQYIIQTPRYVLQEKKDGHRRLIVIKNGTVIGVKRNRQYVPLPPDIIQAARAIDDDAIIDGELVNNDTLYVFDIQRLGGRDFTDRPFIERLEALRRALKDITSPVIQFVPYCVGSAEKCEAFVHDLRAHDAEGVVVTEIDSPYEDGRQASGCKSLKHKFWNSLSAITLAHNSQNSIVLGLYDANGTLIEVGNVAVTNYPPIGSIVEIRYLYCFPLPGRLYQPTYRGVRDDIASAACTTNQLIFKAETR